MTQAQLARTLGYKTVMSVSAIEVGGKSVTPARAYAWAEVLEVPRDAFFHFVTGERHTMDPTYPQPSGTLSLAEAELLAVHRKLPPTYQRQLHDVARALDALARDEQQKR